MTLQGDEATLDALETAAFAAWPSASTSEVKGWTLRMDRGYTKRANSINAGSDAEDLAGADISAVEQAFASRGLAPVWRVTSLARVKNGLLERRGYRFVEPSLVMARGLAAPLTRASECSILDGPQPWLAAFQAVSGQTGAGQAIHLEILERIAHPCAFAATFDADHRPVCCGLGVLVGNVLGIFDVATAPVRRGEGLARRLCGDLMAWGSARGATMAFLQVIEANRGAVRLYESLGFETAYTYGYYLRT